MPRKSRTKALNAATSTPLTEASAANIIYSTAIYVRLSVEDSRDKESDSINNQVYLISQYIAERPDLKLCGIFTDNGETGTNFNRDGFNAMINEVKAGRINCIVVKDLSRFGRNYIETGEYLEKILPFMGVRFISINDGLDNHDESSSADALIVSLKNLINDVYAKDISQKIISSLRTKQENGDYIGGLPLYGYKKSEEDYRKLVVDDEVAHTVRDIFKWKAEGIGDLTIARRLNELGVPSPMKRRVEKGQVKKAGRTKVFLWRDRTIRLITENPMYIGHMTQGRQKQALCDNVRVKESHKSEWIIVENTHEAIVDKATFDKAQEMRAKNTSAVYKNYDKSKHIKGMKYSFKGMLACGDCGSKLARKKICNDSDKYSFICPIQYRSLGADCRLKSISEIALNEMALISIKVQVQVAANLSAIIERLTKSQDKKNRKSNIDKQATNIQTEIKRLTSLKTALFEPYTDKLLSEDEYIYSKNRYTKQIDEAKAKLEHLQEQSTMQSETLTPENKWLQAFEGLTGHNGLSDEMVQSLISRVIIYSNDEIEIVWSFRDDYEILSEYAKVSGVSV